MVTLNPVPSFGPDRATIGPGPRQLRNLPKGYSGAAGSVLPRHEDLLRMFGGGALDMIIAQADKLPRPKHGRGIFCRPCSSGKVQSSKGGSFPKHRWRDNDWENLVMPRRLANEDDWDGADGGGQGEDESTIPCPYCQHDIHEDSQRGPYCENNISQEDTPSSGRSWWIVVGAGVGLFAVSRWIVAR